MNLTHAGIKIKPDQPLLVGVINLSPESFYKGSVANQTSVLEDKIEEFAQYEVDCLDVGAMSTRPLDLYGGEQASIQQEKQRVKELLPDLMDLADEKDLPVALDTQYAEVASIGISLGISVINDISGFKTDPVMAELIADNEVDAVIMATDTKPGDVCGIDATLDALESSLAIADKAGIARQNIAIDPGFGGWQGRGSHCDLELIKNFERFGRFSLPIYIGVSRKSTIGTLEGGNSPEERLSGSLILTHNLVNRGANIVRTHDVKETRLALNVRKSIQGL